jgi:hypothetical protein
VPTLNATSMLFSPHAARRFAKRYRPDLKGSSERYTAEWANSALTPNDAMGPFPAVPTDLAAALCDLVAAAAYAGTTVGGELWQAPDASGQQIPFVVRRDPKVGCEVMVTVLPPRAAAPEPEELDEIVAAYQRLMRSTVDAEVTGARGGPAPCATPSALAAAPKAPTKAAEDKANRAIALEWVRLAANKKKLQAAQVNRETERARGARNAATPTTDGALRHERDSATHLARRLREALDHQDVELRRIKVALKVALRAIAAIGDTAVGAAAMAQIRAIDPGLLTQAFLADGPKILKGERIRQSEEARATHGYDPDAWKRVKGGEEVQA